MVPAGFRSESSHLRKAGIYVSSPVRISYNCGKAVHVSLEVMPVWPSWAAGRTNRRQIKQQSVGFHFGFPSIGNYFLWGLFHLYVYFLASLILPYQRREKKTLILESGLDYVVPSSWHCWTKNVAGGTGCGKLLNSTLHVQCGLNKNTSFGLIACALWGSREAIEANLNSHVTSSVSLKNIS